MICSHPPSGALQEKREEKKNISGPVIDMRSYRLSTMIHVSEPGSLSNRTSSRVACYLLLARLPLIILVFARFPGLSTWNQEALVIRPVLTEASGLHCTDCVTSLRFNKVHGSRFTVHSTPPLLPQHHSMRRRNQVCALRLQSTATTVLSVFFLAGCIKRTRPRYIQNSLLTLLCT